MLWLQKTPDVAETNLPKGRCEGPRGQVARLRSDIGLAVFARFLHNEEGAQRGPVRGVGLLLSAGFAVRMVYAFFFELFTVPLSKTAHAKLRERSSDEWVRFGRRQDGNLHSDPALRGLPQKIVDGICYPVVSRPRLRRRSTILREEGRLAPHTPSFILKFMSS